MSMALLGRHFDLHTGGVDHRELHHVNEIAQSQAYLGDGLPWVRYWLHNEFLQLGAAKMAKSAGGAPRLADLTEAGYHPMAYRLFLLGGHYRSQLDFTTAAVDAAQATLRRLAARIQPLRPLPAAQTLPEAAAAVAADPAATRLLDTIDAAIAADLGTPGEWVLVTREETGGDTQYEGLGASYHVTLARLASVPGGYAVQEWLPQT